MGLTYGHPVDMWSLGCIIVELIQRRPLFPALDENELLEMMRSRIGMPSQQMIQMSRRRR
jgi:dual specificity tyrosine-phosphorylation-regulated kinase 2/3/4